MNHEQWRKAMERTGDERLKNEVEAAKSAAARRRRIDVYVYTLVAIAALLVLAAPFIAFFRRHP